ncbi:hypothetical protein [Roseateles sp. NT4]|uniref:hypothetical protein n=1 Tax=Roseateles sp. NT4 TaxID=3453715 RepID=UPI003F71C5DD
MGAEKSRDLVEGTDRLLRAIGHVVVAFQLLELWVAEALSAALRMKSVDDRHLVSAAMSYRQKVDLLFELYARHGMPASEFNPVIAKRAMLVAEEFRNRVVHSVWALHGEESRRWVRTKANLRGRSGFDVVTRPAQAELLEAASRAMNNVRNWEEGNEAELTLAIQALSAQEADF